MIKIVYYIYYSQDLIAQLLSVHIKL